MKIQTSRLRTKLSPTLSQTRGFTLIEILLVIVIIALLASTVVPNVTKVFRASVKSSVRRYASLVRYAYDQAVFTGRVHRIVLDLDRQAWHVEVAQAGTLPLNPDLAREQSAEERGKSEEEFTPVKSQLVSSLPSGVEIRKVESWRLGPKGTFATKGLVSIYTFPSGLVDEATVELAEAGREKMQSFKITTNSITGRVKIVAEDNQ